MIVGGILTVVFSVTIFWICTFSPFLRFFKIDSVTYFPLSFLGNCRVEWGISVEWWNVVNLSAECCCPWRSEDIWPSVGICCSLCIESPSFSLLYWASIFVKLLDFILFDEPLEFSSVVFFCFFLDIFIWVC